MNQPNRKNNKQKNQTNSDNNQQSELLSTLQNNKIKPNDVHGHKGSGNRKTNKVVDEEEHTLDNVGLNHNRHKLVPDGNDFKLVFISSDSSKESDNLNSLNSSLESGNSPDALIQAPTTNNITETPSNLLSHQKGKTFKQSHNQSSKGEFDCIATSSPKEGRSASKTPPKLPPKVVSKRAASKLGGSSNSSGASSMEMDSSKINSENGSNQTKGSSTAPHFMLDHDFHHYDTGLIGAGSCSSPSVNTIRTAATRDVDSPVSMKHYTNRNDNLFQNR